MKRRTGFGVKPLRKQATHLVGQDLRLDRFGEESRASRSFGANSLTVESDRGQYQEQCSAGLGQGTKLSDKIQSAQLWDGKFRDDHGRYNLAGKIESGLPVGGFDNIESMMAQNRAIHDSAV